MGPGLQRLCDLYGLKAETLLGDLLAHYELSEVRLGRVGPRHPRDAPATEHPAAVVELDRDTRAIRKLTLVRQTPGNGTVTLTFLLVETRPVDDVRYRLEGHLTEPFQIYDRTSGAAKRREILSRWVGPAAADRWLIAPAKK